MKDKITITFKDLSTKEYDKSTTLETIAKDYQPKMDNPILGAKINNELIELSKPIKKDAKIEFLDVNELNGYKMYQAGLKFIMIVAVKELYKGNVKVIFEHSIDKGIMCSLEGNKEINNEVTEEIKAHMTKLIEQNLPIKKLNINKKEAISFFDQINEHEKASNIQKISDELLTIYKLKDNYNYFYIEMPTSTGVLNKFDITYLEENRVVLMFPSPRSNNEVPKYVHNAKIVNVFHQDTDWIEHLNIKYASSFNDYVAGKDIAKFIRMNEIVFNHKIGLIVKDIMETKDNLKMILIAGPSSSGKTTSTKQLALMLESYGHKIQMISVDDYFKERTETPTNEKGEYDFESLNAIDVDLFNKQLLDLINYKPVRMPIYDFLQGKKVYPKEYTQIDEKTILLIEGLHCLNEELTSQISRDVKYKIYLSPFTPLSIDRHNHVSTVDLRLIRRIVRDNRTRGYSVEDTISNWQNVRLGEEKYIFPYMVEADSILNTALIYELGVLRVFAEPLLYSVSVESIYYEEARRLLVFLKNFFPIPSEYVVDHSIIREFIGKSFFE